MPMHGRLLLCTLILAAFGCAGTQPRPAAVSPPDGEARTAVERVEMSPFYFEGTPQGLDIYTDTDLFHRAADAYDMGEWRRAFNLYRKIIDKFPDSPYRILSFYNAGLSLVRLRDESRALDYFRATEELISPRAALMQDVWFQMGAIYENSAKWEDAALMFAQLAEHEDIPEKDAWQYRARAAVAEAYAEKPGAVEALEEFVRMYRAFLRPMPLADRQWLARAQFSLGEVHFRSFQAIRLRLPQERLEADLNRKAELLLRAQHHYMGTLQIQDVHWATAAVYRIGLAYEEFYFALNRAPVPPELNDEEVVVYREELLKATEPVREKAIAAYDRIISFANRLSIHTDWVDQARDRVVELRTAGRFLLSEDNEVH
jgi:tetratricopeptide (TPR) repeat protein